MARPARLILRAVGTMIAAAALYGFAVGWVHSAVYAFRNLIKMPLLLLGTASVCTIAYVVSARLVTGRLSTTDVVQVVWQAYRDVAVLLASLASVCLFLALTIERPTAATLGEYPRFLGFNVALFALCGCLATGKHAWQLLKLRELGVKRTVLILSLWMGLSLVVGGQWAWYLRPFYGVATLPAGPFCLGTAPDFRGARSFFEAVSHLALPGGEVPDDDSTRRNGH